MPEETASGETRYEMHEVWHSEGGVLEKPKEITGHWGEGLPQTVPAPRNDCFPGSPQLTCTLTDTGKCGECSVFVKQVEGQSPAFFREKRIPMYYPRSTESKSPR